MPSLSNFHLLRNLGQAFYRHLSTFFKPFQVYHLACLGRDKMPREKWFCPWHHCVQCGKLAVAYCMHCPNAYCKNHNTVINS